MARSRAFTLLEILIVIVILGILAAIVVPHYTGASQTLDQKIKELEAVPLKDTKQVAELQDLRKKRIEELKRLIEERGREIDILRAAISELEKVSGTSTAPPS